MNAEILIDFMQRIIKGGKRKVFLIFDNLRVHYAKLVKAWRPEHEDEIEVLYLPSYSPGLNPDEYMNCDLKAGVADGTRARCRGQLQAKAIAHFRKLQKLPGRVGPLCSSRLII